MAEHVTLKAGVYESTFRDLPRAVSDERWRALLDAAQFELDRPLGDYLDGPLIPLVAGQRQLSAPAAVTPVFVAFLAACEVERRRSPEGRRVWSDLLGGAQGDLSGLWERLGGDGSPGFLTYQGLLGTVGLGGGRPSTLPWWMGDTRHGNGAFASAGSVGLISPATLRALLKAARTHGVLATVKGYFAENAVDPAAAPLVIDEHEQLLAFLEDALLRGDWVLGME